MAEKDVTIIIVNYNTKDLTLDCLKTIFEKTQGIDFEVIVSDNGSKDGSIDAIKKDFPQVTLIENNANLGFGTANNRGLDVAKGKYVFYLNSDTILLNNAVKIFFDYYEAYGEKENIGALGCNLINGENKISRSFGSFLNIDNELKNSFHQLYGISKLSAQRILFQKKTYSAEKRFEFYQGAVDCIIGADLFLPNNADARFDERYFMYHEEQDLQFQLMKKNLQRIIIDGPQIVHLESKSSENKVDEILSLTSFSSKYCSISSIIYFKKNMPDIPKHKIFILRTLKTLLWLNPFLIKNNFKYIKKLWS